MTDKDREKVQRLLQLTRAHNPICQKCKFFGLCFFAYDCLTNDYFWFMDKKLFENT